ncbi:hypothetical protein N9H69_06190 [Flavobacteriaceae bacterium]|nr:hypothetical protein [Flavobacteriaceae bacterium]
MKKLLFFPLLIIAFACSSDEIDDDTETSVDPIIGSWTFSYDGDTAQVVVKSDGTLTETQSNGDFTNAIWVNLGENFKSRLQNYTLSVDDGDGTFYDAIFNTTFTEGFDFFSYQIITNDGDDSASGTATRN